MPPHIYLYTLHCCSDPPPTITKTQSSAPGSKLRGRKVLCEGASIVHLMTWNPKRLLNHPWDWYCIYIAWSGCCLYIVFSWIDMGIIGMSILLQHLWRLFSWKYTTTTLKNQHTGTWVCILVHLPVSSEFRTVYCVPTLTLYSWFHDGCVRFNLSLAPVQPTSSSCPLAHRTETKVVVLTTGWMVNVGRFILWNIQNDALNG